MVTHPLVVLVIIDFFVVMLRHSVDSAGLMDNLEKRYDRFPKLTTALG